MKRVFVFLPLCLAACAPAMTTAPKAKALPLGSVGCSLDLAKLAAESSQNDGVALYKSSCPLTGGEHRLQATTDAGPHEHCVSVVNNTQEAMRSFSLSGNFAEGRVYQRPEAYQGKMIKVLGGENPQFLELGDEGVFSNVANGSAGYRVFIDVLRPTESVSVCTVVAKS